MYREFDSSSSPLVCTRERQLDYQQRSIVIHGQSEVLGDKEIKPSLGGFREGQTCIRVVISVPHTVESVIMTTFTP